TQAIISGALVVPNEPVAHIEPVCSSGECEWPVYGTLGICSEVVNLTALNNPALISNLRNFTAAQLKTTLSVFTGSRDELMGPSNVYSTPTFPLIIHILSDSTGAINASLEELLISDVFVAFSNTPIK